MSGKFKLSDFGLDALNKRMRAARSSPARISVAAALLSLAWALGLGYAADVFFSQVPHASIFDLPQLSMNLFNTLILTPAIVFYFDWIHSRSVGSAQELETLGLIRKSKPLSRMLARAVNDKRVSILAFLTSFGLFWLTVLWAWPQEARHLGEPNPFLLSPVLYLLYSLWFIPLIYLLAGNIFRLLVIAHNHDQFFASKNSLKKILMFGEDKVGGMGKLGDFYIGVGWFAAIFVFWVICETTVLPLLSGRTPDPSFAVWLVFAYLFLLIAILVRGASAIHRAMVEKKKAILSSHYKRLDEYNNRIARYREARKQKVKLSELINIRTGLTDHISYLEKNLPTWPFNVPRVVFSWTLPPQAVLVAFFADLLDVMEFVRGTIFKAPPN